VASSLIPESHRDLPEKCQIVALSTFGHDGFPQVTAMWFLADEDGTIACSLNTGRQKVKNLQRMPECALFFVDPETPYRTLEIRARAEIALDPDYAFADRLGAKYGGTDLRSMDRPGETRVVVRFRAVKVNTAT